MNRLRQAFARVPLRWKVVSIMLGVAAASLLLAGAGLLLRERLSFERAMEQRLVLLATVVGSNSTAALAFNDAAAASEILAALAADEHVMAGALYGADDALFARYLRADVERALPERGPAAGPVHFGGGTAALARNISLKGRPIGKVYLLADTAEWRDTLLAYTGIVGLLFGVVLTIGLFVSMWLQRLVTEPIVDLAELTRRVAQERDYGLRAVKRADDELGVLVGGFNDMLDEIAKNRAEIEKSHAALRRLNEDLERRVAERTAQLETANGELEAFSYSVSHDLRAPLRSIDGFSRILLEDHAPALNAEARDCLDRVRNAAQRMSALIDDLLMLARVTRAEPARADVDLSALAHAIADALRAQEPERAVDIAIAPDLTVRGDARLLHIALENLIGNAWKFTAGRTPAQIEVGASVENGERVYYVRDNGAGFDMNYAAKLFTPFQRLHATEQFPGTGIGLATVQRIVRKHNGRVWAQGTVGRGATFYFTIG